jgi:hypothetical protein
MTSRYNFVNLMLMKVTSRIYRDHSRTFLKHSENCKHHTIKISSSLLSSSSLLIPLCIWSLNCGLFLILERNYIPTIPDGYYLSYFKILLVWKNIKNPRKPSFLATICPSRFFVHGTIPLICYRVLFDNF